MLPLLVVFGKNLSGAFYSILTRRLAVKLPYAQFQIALVVMTVTMAVSLPLAFLYGGVQLEALQRWWPYLLLGGVATSMSAIATFVVFRYMDAAMGTLLGTTYIVMGVLAGLYILGEQMGLQEIAGAGIVLSAVVYALSVHVSRRERRHWTLGIFYTLAGAVFFSIGVMVEKFLLGEMSMSSYVVWGFGSQWLVMLLLSTCFGWRYFPKVINKRNALLLLAAGLTRSAMALLFVVSLVTLKSLCLAVVLSGMRPLFVAFLGASFLHERRFLARKVVASLVAGAGIAVMFW
jgi:drug/metabolite transporter (DMT)-like permease